MAEIIINIPADHNKEKVTIEVNGHVGPACKDLTRSIENALGGEATVDEKPEFREVQKSKLENKQKLGGW